MIQNVLCFLEESAEAYPHKTAFADEHTSLTYRRLSDLSMRIGSVLGQKTGPRRPVPVLAEKNVFTLTAFMGIVRAGCFYVFLDAGQPAERLNRILDTLQADLMIADKESLSLAGPVSFSGEILPLEDLMSLPDDALNPGLLASIRRQSTDTDPLYGIFTSGSTGVPRIWYRGHNWTRAVLGLRAEEIHLCMAPEAEDIVVQMIKRCGDRYRVVRHKRNTRLTMEKKPYNLKRDLKKGDALIVFSKKSVLALAAHLENEGIHCSVIYGSLPPATRREQVRRFLARETEVVVSTDAIGMGLNLPIRRIVFVETRKFDGVNKRTLNPEEIKQIAGRAGRYGLYDEGFVAAIDEAEVIEDGLSRMPMPIMKAYVGFPEQLLNLPAEIDTLVKIWAGMDTPSIYEKMEVDELLALYMSFEHVHRDDMGEYSRQEIYKLITCSIDIDNKMVMDLWKDYCREYRDVTELEFPYSPGEDLYELESYYKMLDLYFQFSRKVGLPVQAENLAEERRGTEEEISRILRTECASYTRKCSACGKELSWDYPFSICGRCFERGKISRGHSRSGRRRAAGNRV